MADVWDKWGEIFIDHASCTLTAQVLKEYEKTISELIADKERDKKALEAEVQLFSLTMDFCSHGNFAFTCFFNRCRRCSRRRSRQWKIFRWTKTLASLGKKIGAAGHLCVFSLITIDSFLQNVEAAFADVHRKYERTKQVAGFKNLSWSLLYYDL